MVTTFLMVCFFLCTLSASNDDDIHATIHYRRKGTQRSAPTQEMLKTARPEEIKQLSRTLHDQTLSGRILHQSVEYWKSGPQLLHEDVLDIISRRVSFQSQEMDKAFQQIRGLLEKHPLKKLRFPNDQLRAKDVKKICPPGEKRTWKVTRNAQNRRHDDNLVLVSFDTSKDSLESVATRGTLPQQEGTSLLQVKQYFATHRKEPDEVTSWRQKSLQSSHVGVLYFEHEDSAPYGALFDVSEVKAGMSYRQELSKRSITLMKSISFAHVIHQQKLRGYILKPALRGHLNYEKCEHPNVREALCDRAPFFSNSLEMAVQSILIPSLQSPKKSSQTEGWQGLQTKHLQSLYSDTQTIQWSIVDQSATLKAIEEGAPQPAGSLLIATIWDDIALQGIPAPPTDTDEEPIHSLAYYSVIRIIAASNPVQQKTTTPCTP